MRNVIKWMLAGVVLAGGGGVWAPMTDAARGAEVAAPGSAGVKGVEVYRSAFEKGAGGEWSKKEVTTSPNGKRTFLGRLGAEGVGLSLEDLPEHGRVRISFDVIILMTWDGDASMEVAADGPDVFDVTVEKGPRLVHTTFELRSRWSRFTQGHPGRFPYDHFGSGTGAVETGTLGYVLKDHAGGVADDCVYRIERSFGHTGKALKVVFSGLNLEGLENESWGLADVRVEVLPEAVGKVEEAAFAKMWGDLGAAEWEKFVPAVEGMVELGDAGAGAIRKRLMPAAPGKEQAELIRQLIVKLDDDSFRERETASARLQALGAAAEGALREARGKTTSEEVRSRIDQLLAQLKGDEAGDVRRWVRLVEVLERIGTEDARAGLMELAKREGRFEGWEAKGALERLAGKAEVPTKVVIPPGIPKGAPSAVGTPAVGPWEEDVPRKAVW